MTDVINIRPDVIIQSSPQSGALGGWARQIGGVAVRIMRTRIGAIAAVCLLLLLLFSWIGPVVYTEDPNNITGDYLANPSSTYPAGTDTLGRDTLSRLMHGGRVSFTAAVGAGLLGVVVAVPLGVIAGYSRGWVDHAVMRLMDTIYSFPTILLALAIVAVLGRGLDKVIIAIAIWGVPAITRLVRAETLAARETDYVQAAHAVGAGHWRIIFRHVMPNVASPAIIQATGLMSGAVLLEASLGFLGTGVPAPQATWGGMLLEAVPTMQSHPFQTLVPGAFIFLLVFSLNLLGDVLRDVLDPRLRNT